MPAPSLDGTALINESKSATGTWTSATNKSTAGSNRLGVVFLGGIAFGSGGITATWGGVSMTQQFERRYATDNQYVVCFTLTDPPTAASQIVVSGLNSFYGMASACSFKDAGAISGVTTGEGNTSTPTITISSATGDLVFAGIGEYNKDPAVGSGQTEISENNDGGTNWGSSSYEAGAASVVMDWSLTVGSSNLWVSGGFSIAAVFSGKPWYGYAQQA